MYHHQRQNFIIIVEFNLQVGRCHVPYAQPGWHEVTNFFRVNLARSDDFKGSLRSSVAKALIFWVFFWCFLMICPSQSAFLGQIRPKTS